MGWIDLAIIGIVIISALLSLMRGFVREVLSTANLVGSFLIAIFFGASFASFLQQYIEHELTREVSARVILFFVSLVVFGIANIFLARIIRITGIGESDKFLGLLFGFIRGLVIVLAIAFLLELIAPATKWDADTLLASEFRTFAIWIKVNFIG